MKVIIQIPAYNEEKTLKVSIDALPKTLPGIDSIDVLVINDGSSDNTAEVAKACGVTHVVSHSINRGLAKTFMTGIKHSLSLGADIIVNTDADNQYNAEDIPKLLQPIIDNEADMVIGERPINSTAHFSVVKKCLQRVGSLVVRLFSHTTVQDAPSGFRAIRRSAAMQLNVFNTYTYTIETLIQAGRMGIKTISVPVRTNRDLRPSRLVKSIKGYVQQSAVTMIRAMNTYRPMTVFMTAAVFPFVAGSILVCRWLIFFMGDHPATHLPSLILGVALVGISIQLVIFGFMADIISVNRKLLEDIQLHLRHRHWKNNERSDLK